MEKTEIYTSKKKVILLFIASLAFVFGGIHMFIEPETFRGFPAFTKTMGVITILFFGFGVLVFAKRLIQNQLILVIDKKGINVNPKKSLVEIIEWKYIDGFSEIKIHNAKIIIIKVTNPEYWIEKETNKFRKKLMKFNTRHYNSPFNFSSNSTKISHTELMKLLNENLKKHKYVG